MSAGGGTTCGIKKNQRLFCWGVNHRGQLGDGTDKPRTRPTVIAKNKKWTAVNAGWFNTCGITAQTKLYCWGDNAAGQIGDGGKAKVRTKPTLVKRGKNWASVSVGSRFVCGTKKSGALFCWGGNLFGQLGLGSYAGRTKPTRVGTGQSWAEVSTSWTHTCARDTSGGVACWGRNTFGQVGDGTVTTTATPQAVPGLKAVDITTIEGASCAIDDRARVQCWGNNAYGVIGDGSKPFTTSPEPGPTDMREIEGGWRHVCGITTSGSPYCWGQNDRAQLGNGTLTSSPSPTEVEPLPPADPSGATDFRIATVNALGNGHTRPYAGDDSYAPATTRMTWMADQLDNSAIDIMGLQEANADQTAHLLKAARGTWDVYPRPEAGDDAAEAALAWRTSVWELVEASTMMNQFISKELPRPIVKLRHKVTGKEIYVINIHNAPWDYQFKRNKASGRADRQDQRAARDRHPGVLRRRLQREARDPLQGAGQDRPGQPLRRCVRRRHRQVHQPAEPDARGLDLRLARGDVLQLRVHPPAAAEPGHRPQHGAGRRPPALTGRERAGADSVGSAPAPPHYRPTGAGCTGTWKGSGRG